MERTSSNHPLDNLVSIIAENPSEAITWLNQNLRLEALANGKTITGATTKSYTDAGGSSLTQLTKLILTLSDDSVVTLVYKSLPATLHQRSKDLGQARESLFYEYFSHVLQSNGVRIPIVAYTYGDMTTGEKTIAMEAIDAIQCGYFYGPGSPLNWNKDLQSIIAPALINPITELELRKNITHEVFSQAAKMHAKYWHEKDILSHAWLRGSSWILGAGEEAWKVSQKTVYDMWLRLEEKLRNNEKTTVKWDPFLLKCMTASFAKISWEDFQASKANNETSWTLVHGDFHPANFMWDASTSSLFMLDWEMVGIGNGPQDIAQYLISHADPQFRKENESEFISTYYNTLIEFGRVDPSTYSIEKCRAEYVSGGVGRWVWMLALLTAIVPEPNVQYFHDQLLAFILDHGVTPENICMPRV